MSNNILHNTKMAERFEQRRQAENLQPIGQMYFDNYKLKRLDSRTTILIKPDNFKVDKKFKVVRKGKQLKKQ